MKDDAQLIDEALAGDSAAFGHLVTKYQDRLYNTLVHVVGTSEAAFDGVQDAMVQAYVKLETFQRTSSFYTWLYRIAFNLAVSRHRREKQTLSLDRARDASGAEPADNGCGRPPAWSNKNGPEVQAALATLSEEHLADPGPARSTIARTKRSPRSWTCRSAPSAAGSIGPGCNCAIN